MDALVTATFTFPEPPPVIPPEMSGRLLFVLHDAYTEYYNYTTRFIGGGALGTPATCKAADSASEKMFEAYQWLWFDALQHFAPGRSHADGLKQWQSLTHGAKAFTNNTGTEQYADYVSGNNLDKEPAKQENIVCTGNTLISAGIAKNIGGNACTGVLALDRDALPSLDVLLAHPACFSFLTVATVTLKVNTAQLVKPSTVVIPPIAGWSNKVIDPFPNNPQITPVPFASFTGDKVDFMGLKCRVKFIRSERLVKLPDNEFPLSPLVGR